VAKRNKGKFGPCVFCPRTAKYGKEDIVPKWAAEIIRGGEPDPWRNLLFSAEGRPTKLVGSASTYKLLGICEECNNGWMSDIETDVIEVATKMIKGESLTLSESDQTALATWGALKALCFDRWDGTGYFAEADFREFHRTRKPPEGFCAWVACFPPHPWIRAFRVSSPLFQLGRGPGSPGEVPMDSTLEIGCFVIRFLAVPGRMRDQEWASINHGDYDQQIWPVSERPQWPPLSALSGAYLAAYAGVPVERLLHPPPAPRRPKDEPPLVWTGPPGPTLLEVGFGFDESGALKVTMEERGRSELDGPE
jgi:hypothetical protein